MIDQRPRRSDRPSLRPPRLFRPASGGELGTQVAELEKIREFLTGQALTTVLDAAFSVIYIVVLVIYSWLLTLIALSVLQSDRFNDSGAPFFAVGFVLLLRTT